MSDHFTTLQSKGLKNSTKMNEPQLNQSYCAWSDETLLISYQKSVKIKIACYYPKLGDIYWSENSAIARMNESSMSQAIVKQEMF